MAHDYTKGPLDRGPRGPFTRHSGPVHTLVIHYSWTDPRRETPMSEIARWHADRNFNGPGYQFYIRTNGALEYGRPEWARGAHAGGHNDRTIGVCFEGGRIPGSEDGHDTRTPDQIKTMKDLLHTLQARHPGAKVKGHRDLSATLCPGFDAAAWWGKKKQKPAPVGAPPVTRPAPRPRSLWTIIINALRVLFGRIGK